MASEALQRRAVLGDSADASEREAEAVATRLEGPAPPRQPPAGHAVPDPDPDRAVRAAARQGTPLPAALRSRFEPRFGHDFSRVRVHADDEAAVAARGLQAHAYTVGGDIVFGAGEYRPDTQRGRRLIAHELTHIVQQGQAGPLAPASAPIRRYGHTSSCTSADLTGIVWPGDAAMRTMLAKAIRVLSASPIDPRVSALFPKYFMSPTPAVSKILDVYKAIQAVVTGSAYVYECEATCDPNDAAYVRDRLRYLGINPNIHLCTGPMSGYAVDCNASLILHELSHYAAHLDDEAPGCGSCSTAGCPSSLSPADALDNTYSYADFALELYALPV